MSCSARLPVYVFLTSMLFVGQPLYAAVAFAGCYLLGAARRRSSAPRCCAARLVKGTARPMVLELPELQGAVVHQRADLGARSGLRLPQDRRHDHHGDQRGDVVAERLSDGRRRRRRRSRCSKRAAATADQAAAKALLAAGRLGAGAGAAAAAASPDASAASPSRSSAPLGYDWQLTVGILTSFLAREVFVSTMSVLLGGSDDPDLADTGVISAHPRRDARRRLAAVHAGHVGQRAGVLRAGDAVHCRRWR